MLLDLVMIGEVTNSVNNCCHQEQTFQKIPYTIHSYGQLMIRCTLNYSAVKSVTMVNCSLVYNVDW